MVRGCGFQFSLFDSGELFFLKYAHSLLPPKKPIANITDNKRLLATVSSGCSHNIEIKKYIAE